MIEIIRGAYFSQQQEFIENYCERTGRLAPNSIKGSALHWVGTMDAFAKENNIVYEPTTENDKRFEKIIKKELGCPYIGHDFRDPKHYVNILDEFVKTGQVPDYAAPWEDDYLEKYLREVMSDPFVTYSVLSDEVKARVFYDNMLAFIKQIVIRENFRKTCAQGQTQKMQQALLWSERKRRDGWSRLLSEISGEYEEFGFDERYYRDKFGNEGELADEETWKKMIEDWTKAFDRKQQQLRERDIDETKENNSNILKQNLNDIPEYLRKKGVEKEQFYQVWGLMGGQWNSLLFDQQLGIVKLQKRYPQLELMANKMGRIADEEAAERMPVAIGGNMKMEHAAKNDILGVALSKDIRSMLPLEMAQCSDDELYDVFLYKYATRNLQTFHHKSEMLKPSRQVAPRPARLKGPMIVCVDRSGSMSGLPEQLANSLMMKLLTIAERQKRSLYLISFSVDARPIEVRHNRTALLDFFRQRSVGDTNATKMLQQVFTLLASGEYASADVLWFSDFRIPLCGVELRKQLTLYRRQGTKFYGLKIGHAFDQGWEEYFDEIVEIA